ncbi:hypothetical protein GCM10010389_22400 [Streptomyces echinoruber]|uniref:Uncharacterized protein n=1 Tax=Streptomyces echinoruber TaxID=68898 RepID=A0A918R324_9ACTN|nr:hypothetical protein GCM10010389_22400 [Streptomyces echinoruber]
MEYTGAHIVTTHRTTHRSWSDSSIAQDTSGVPASIAASDTCSGLSWTALRKVPAAAAHW